VLEVKCVREWVFSGIGSRPLDGSTDSSELHRKQNNHLICFVPKTVLIADDSASMRLSVRFLLQGRHSGLKVREAVDGLDAIEKAKRLETRNLI